MWFDLWTNMEGDYRVSKQYRSHWRRDPAEWGRSGGESIVGTHWQAWRDRVAIPKATTPGPIVVGGGGADRPIINVYYEPKPYISMASTSEMRVAADELADLVLRSLDTRGVNHYQPGLG